MANKSDIELRNFFTQIDKDGKWVIEHIIIIIKLLEEICVCRNLLHLRFLVDNKITCPNTTIIGDNLIDFNDFKTLLKGLDNRLTDRDVSIDFLLDYQKLS